MIRFVTTNDGKYKEVSQLLASKGIEIERINLSYPEVQANSLEEVVRKGLEFLSDEEGDILIDDSGLFIEKLGGFPGVYSSYIYKTLGCEGILKLMLGWKQRAARFEACFGLRFGKNIHIFFGTCEGSVATEMRGKGGFGFDPIFKPKDSSNTFAQMNLKEKNSYSHRGRAAMEVARFLLKEKMDE